MKLPGKGYLRQLARRLGAYAANADPLAENTNWVALTIGTHLPFWPLYVWWCAGDGFSPTAILTIAFAPLFMAIPMLSHHSAIAARIATPIIGIGNTVYTAWILGIGSGTELFLVACAALAALSFRRTERWLMLALTSLPLIVWYAMLYIPPTPLHHYKSHALHELFILNAISIGVLLTLFGWFQTRIYQRMESAGGR